MVIFSQPQPPKISISAQTSRTLLIEQSSMFENQKYSDNLEYMKKTHFLIVINTESCFPSELLRHAFHTHVSPFSSQANNLCPPLSG